MLKNKWGFINLKGIVEIPLIYDLDEWDGQKYDGLLYSFCKGFSYVKLDSKYGLIDINNKIQIPLIYDELTLF